VIALEDVRKSYRTGRKRKVVISDASRAAAGVSLDDDARHAMSGPAGDEGGPARDPWCAHPSGGRGGPRHLRRASKYARVVECLTKDRDALLAFYDLSAEHWIIFGLGRKLVRALTEQLGVRSKQLPEWLGLTTP
jgi:hypothetical protein